MREIVILACEECKQRNYSTMKNRRIHPERVVFKKYCPFCRKHTSHKQTR
ncbi:MAG: 50S ribosomal protein L33 [Candidatus Stygibacter australis]|nr:50S ribosomal protein L33 [Candidatus Stygibacter australis]